MAFEQSWLRDGIFSRSRILGMGIFLGLIEKSRKSRNSGDRDRDRDFFRRIGYPDKMPPLAFEH